MQPSSRHRITAALALAVSMLALSPIANAWDYGVHTFPVGESINCMSYDGSTVSGASVNGELLIRTQSHTRAVNPYLAYDQWIAPGGSVAALNNDGSVFGAQVSSVVAGQQSVIDRGASYTVLGPVMQSSFHNIKRLSGDGTVALVDRIPHNEYADFYLVYSDGTPVPQTPTPPEISMPFAYDLSKNGQVVVGYASNVAGYSFPIRYRLGVGYEIITPPSNFTNVVPNAVSADGSVMAGRHGNDQAFVWRNGVFTDLTYDQLLYSRAYVSNMNDDGAVIVGGLRPIASTQSVGAIWFDGQGWVNAQAFFASLGIFMPEGRTIRYINEVSSDGHTFLGSMDNNQYFVVTIPAPSSLALLAPAAFASRRRRC